MYDYSIIFYAEGSKDIGLGHLGRTIALFNYFNKEFRDCKLYFKVDSFSSKWLLNSGVKYEEEFDDQINCDVIFIDTTSVSKRFANRLSNISKKILISPIFNLMDLPTHILVRDSSGLNIGNIKSDVILISNPEFSLITSCFSKPHKSNYQSLNIGVCLSGGSQDFPIKDLLRTLNAMPEVGQVIYITNSEHEFHGDKLQLHCKVESPDELWEVFKNINVFIGRQGLMVFEAMHRGVPVISLRESDEVNKITTDMAGGNMLFYDVNDSEGKVTDFLKNRQLLKSINKRLIKQNMEVQSDALYSVSRSIVLN